MSEDRITTRLARIEANQEVILNQLEKLVNKRERKTPYQSGIIETKDGIEYIKNRPLGNMRG